MQALLLAAGRGLRLGEFTTELPKTLLPLEGRPLLENIVDSLCRAGFDDLKVVGGFSYGLIENFLKAFCPFPFQMTVNDQYKLGSILTIKQAFQILNKESFIVFNADHFYSDAILSKMATLFSAQPRGITVFCDRDRSLTDDDMKVSADAKGCLLKMDKKLTDYGWGYVGATFVPSDKRELYQDYLQKTIEVRGEGVSVESILDFMASLGEEIYLADISGSFWLELDTPSDYVRAKEIFGNIREKNLIFHQP